MDVAASVSEIGPRAVAYSSFGNFLHRKFSAYLALTKPRIIELLLVVTVPTMILAQRGIPNLWLVFATVVGGFLSAGSAGAFNCYIDRDIDRVMRRTRKRPLVTGELSDREAFIFCWVLAVASTLILGIFANWLTAALSVIGILLYAGFYTLVLKRRTQQNIIWGGIAGCMPVFIGWAAVTDTIAWPAVVLFVVIFLWTPPHYWPFSMRFRDDYRHAGVPMLAVVRGRAVVGMQVILYTWATVACTLLLIPVAHMGIVYTVVAAVSGGWFVYEAHHLYNTAIRHTTLAPMRVFHASITYLTVVFLAVAIDPLIPLHLFS